MEAGLCYCILKTIKIKIRCILIDEKEINNYKYYAYGLLMNEIEKKKLNWSAIERIQIFLMCHGSLPYFLTYKHSLIIKFNVD